MAYNIVLQPGQVSVGIYRGSGATFTGREFTGTGVTGFDAAKGTQLGGTLTESTSPGSNTGTLGVVASISGNIDCGNFQPGSSSLTVTGTTGDGTVSGGLNPFQVVCYTAPNASGVRIAGLTHAGGTPVALIIFIRKDTFTMSQTHLPAGSTSYFYTAQGAGIASFTAEGGHVGGDATVKTATGASFTVHVSGDVTCGSATNFGS
jgi:hypothetical protein